MTHPLASKSSRFPKRGASLLLLVAIALACAACDQATKSIAQNTLEAGHTVEWVDGVVRWQLAENTGGFLSLGTRLPSLLRSAIFLVFVPLGLLAMVVWLSRADPPPGRAASLGLALAVGGGLGNLIDRVSNSGAVVDFVSLGVGGLRTGIFNLADVAIMAGLGLVLWAMRDAPVEQEQETRSSEA